ncbi:vacuolar basic amino acid transporter 2 [[Candida] jaroonii]|uniref:Vacuolar basic amino acid transporter 2 n=1 Tax=[Candida] jaroonii TaxID=467808 RepID=A0ACA9YGB2_9ASCO|nr:vacuolar basic amino acid transporter 2 [[Candida] jaroonii]
MTEQIQDQAQQLPHRLLLTTLGCLTISLFVSFFDQTAVTTSIPSIEKSLGNSSLINTWCGASYLIANTNFQLQFGRLSDIFGRKNIFLLCIGCLFVGNLVSGFSENIVMLFIFRGISGIGGGGINCLVMITFSDLLTPRERGKYFGFVAISTSLGNGAGPLLGGLLSEKANWRWTFWISCPIAVVSACCLYFFVPLKPVTGSFKIKLKQLDIWGFITSLVGIVFVLVAISGGGETWSWKSPQVLSLLIIGVITFIAFLCIEQFYATIPMIPLYLFKDFHLSLLFLMCLLMGWAYFVDIYYLPLYLQNVRGWSPIMSGLLQLPATCSSSIFGVGVGFLNSKYGNYVACLWFGGAMWCLGTGLKILFNLHSNIGLLVGSNLIQGLGIAFTFQPTLLALLSYSNPKDRAVVTGLRNFFRCFGGAFGLLISGIIFNTLFKKRISDIYEDSKMVEEIIANPNGLSAYGTPVINAYLDCYRDVMISLTALSGLMFLLSLAIKNKNEDEDSKENEKNEDKSSFSMISIQNENKS